MLNALTSVHVAKCTTSQVRLARACRNTTAATMIAVVAVDSLQLHHLTGAVIQAHEALEAVLSGEARRQKAAAEKTAPLAEDHRDRRRYSPQTNRV